MKSKEKFLTSVHRKFIITRQYTVYTLDTFGPKKKRNNLIGILVHKALKICSAEKFKISRDKMDTQKKSLFPEIKKNLNSQTSKQFVPEK